jgi:hypothetical protein
VLRSRLASGSMLTTHLLVVRQRSESVLTAA